MLPAFLYSIGLVIATTSAAFVGDPPTVGQRRLISSGPVNKPVQETAVAAATVGSTDHLMAM